MFWNRTARPVIPQLCVGLLLFLKEHLIQQLLRNHLTVNCGTVQLPKVPDPAANCLLLCLTVTQSNKHFPDFNQHSDFFQELSVDEKVLLEAFITTFDLLWARGACRWRCEPQVSRSRSDWRLWKPWCWQLLLAAGVHVTEMKRRRERRNHDNHNLQHRRRVRQRMKVILKSSSAA